MEVKSKCWEALGGRVDCMAALVMCVLGCVVEGGGGGDIIYDHQCTV